MCMVHHPFCYVFHCIGAAFAILFKYTKFAFLIQIKSNTKTNLLKNVNFSMKVYAELETDCEYNIQKLLDVYLRIMINR